MVKNICILGLGYIGLPTATVFALKGYNVIGVDTNKEVVESLNNSEIITNEPYLQSSLKKVIKEGKLNVTTRPSESDVFIIDVPTPINEDKSPDMRYVIIAVESIVSYLKKGNVVILESTSPVGATEEIVKPIIEKSGLKVGYDIFLGYSPERVMPGNIMYELKNNDRVIGGINYKSAKKIETIYKTIVDGDMYLTDCKTAEMCKLVENTFRDVNIALANELLMICGNLGLNAWEVIKLCNKHPRVNIHKPGPGVGGHCLAIDPWFIINKEEELSKIIKLSRETNDFMPTYVYNTVNNILKNKSSKTITILGLTYKADTDDIRESPIIDLIDIFMENNYIVKVFDPFVKNFYLNEKDIVTACRGSDLLILGVNHETFKHLPLNDIKIEMKGNIILDTRNFLDEDEVKNSGFIYKILGVN